LLCLGPIPVHLFFASSVEGYCMSARSPFRLSRDDHRQGGFSLWSNADRTVKAGLLLAALLGVATVCVAALTQAAVTPVEAVPVP
jgi:hypothetical protein